MIFTTKKEAEAYDKMLDIAERLNEFLQTAEVDIAEDKLDELSFFMAQHREPIGRLLRGGNLETPVKDETSSEPEWDKEETEMPAAAENKSGDAPKRARASKPKAVA
ncbi:YebG family protein [Candidatus Entotheonella palauensis]